MPLVLVIPCDEIYSEFAVEVSFMQGCVFSIFANVILRDMKGQVREQCP